MKTIYSFCFKVSAQNMGNEYCIIIAEAGSHTRKENTRNIPRFLTELEVFSIFKLHWDIGILGTVQACTVLNIAKLRMLE